MTYVMSMDCHGPANDCAGRRCRFGEEVCHEKRSRGLLCRAGAGQGRRGRRGREPPETPGINPSVARPQQKERR